MTRRRIASFVVALVACVPVIRANAGEQFQLDIRLRVDPSLAYRRITEGMKKETETIWAPYGVRIHWADAGASAAGGVFLDASVERQFEAGQRVERPAILGDVVLGPDAPAWRPIRVWFDSTETVLVRRSTIGRGVSIVGVVLDRELIRALGRVLAHEIGHVLIGAPHDRTGLMRATFNANELAEPDTTPFRLTRSGVDRLKSRLRAWRDSKPRELTDDICAVLPAIESDAKGNR